MKFWVLLTLVAVLSAVIGLLLLAFFLFRRRRRRSRSGAVKFEAMWNDHARTHRQVTPQSHGEIPISPPATSSEKKQFNWFDHPTLINEAVENGWPRFGFFARAGNGCKFDIDWEIHDGSSEFMQKIRLNPGMKRNKACLNLQFREAASAIRAALPLPGPQLGNSAFPMEAYFEIIILQADGKDEEDKFAAKKREIIMGVGLTGEGSLPLKVPGSYSGSIGFNSTGSVFLDGKQLVEESDRARWRICDGIIATNNEMVIGCGYNPNERNVYFTVNSQLVHIIYCKNDPFGSPLYPVIVSNTNVSVLVNLGQSPFKFNPANPQRTPNPCFFQHPQAREKPSLLGFEDSAELFSMGSIDSQWQQRGTNSTIYGIQHCLEVSQDIEDELFEISLRNSKKLNQ